MEIDVIELKEKVRAGYDLKKLKFLYYLKPEVINGTIEFEVQSEKESLLDELDLESYIEEATINDLLVSLQEIDSNILETLELLSSDFPEEYYQNIQVYLLKKKSTKKTIPYKIWVEKKFEILVEHEYANLIQDVSLLAVRNDIIVELTY